MWHLLHPFVSIFTGDFDRPRGRYIDENSLETSMLPNPKSIPRINASYIITDLCAGLQDIPWVTCQTFAERYQMATILPTQAAVVPTHEAIVYVIPTVHDWKQSAFLSYFLSFLHRLATETPWLAKTVVVVAPLYPNMTLSDTIQRFVDDSPSSAIMRNMIVLQHGIQDGLRILPGGTRGTLPNMDLVWATQSVLQRYCRTEKLTATHPYSLDNVLRALPKELVTPHVKTLLHFLAFEHHLAFPTSNNNPHAYALTRGVDALTVRGNFDSWTSTQEWVVALESLTRALSNLHERLHHSTRLYLLPNITTFVKHEEYLVPNLLLLIPCVLRALVLGLDKMDRLEWSAVGRTLLVVMTISFLMMVSFQVEEWLSPEDWWWALSRATQSAAMLWGRFLVIVVGVHAMVTRHLSMRCSDSLQFAGCLLCLYVHVPIVFGHVSLAFPSAMVWVPVFAFGGDNGTQRSFWRRMVSLFWVVYTWCIWWGVLCLWDDRWSSPYVLCVALPLMLWSNILHGVVWLGCSIPDTTK